MSTNSKFEYVKIGVNITIALAILLVPAICCVFCFKWPLFNLYATAHSTAVIGEVVLKMGWLVFTGWALYLWYRFVSTVFQLWHQEKMEEEARNERQVIRGKSQNDNSGTKTLLDKLKELIAEALKIAQELRTETTTEAEHGKEKKIVSEPPAELKDKIINLFAKLEQEVEKATKQGDSKV